MVSAVLLLAALILAPVIGGGFGELAGSVLQILVLAAVGLYLLLPRREPGPWARAPGLIALGVSLALFLVSVALSEAIYFSLNQLLFVLACIGAYALAASLCRDSRLAAAAVWAVVVSALWVCVAGIRDYALSTGGGASFWKHLLSTGEHMRLFGPFLNPDFFAGYIVIALPITLGAYLVTRRTSLAVLAGLAFTIEMLALMLTGAKFGIVSAAVALFVFLLLAVATRSLRRSKFTRLLTLAIVLIPLLVLFSNPVRSRIIAAEAGGTQVHSTTFRYFTWSATWDMAMDRPWFGVGPGVFRIAYPRYQIAGPTQHAHQSYLQMAAENGLPCLIAFLAGLFVIAYRAMSSLVRWSGETDHPPRTSDDDTRDLTWRDLVPFSGWRLMCCAIFAGLVGSGVRNIVDSDWYVIGIALPFWTMAGVLVAQSGAVKSEVHLKGAARLAPVVACVVAILLGVSFGAADLIAPDDLPSRGYSPDEIVRRYRQASSVSPLNPIYHRELARYVAVRDPGEADRELALAARLAPTDASNYFWKGVIALDIRRDPEAAIGPFRRVLALAPNSTQAILRLSRAFRALGEPETAESYLRDLQRIEESDYERVKGAPELVDTTYVEAHIHFAERCMRQKSYPRAADEYRRAAKRLEAWRAKPEILEAQRITGRLTPEEERSVLGRLEDAYLGLEKAYTAMKNTRLAREAATRAARTQRDIDKLDSPD